MNETRSGIVTQLYRVFFREAGDTAEIQFADGNNPANL